MKTILFATTNAGKALEASRIAKDAGLGFAFHPMNFAFPNGVPNIDEPYPSFVENALHKARSIAKLLSVQPTNPNFANMGILAEDSGLNVPCLDGAPGIFSARYSTDIHGINTNDANNNQKLITTLQKKIRSGSLPADSPIPAFYSCTCAFIHPCLGENPIITQGFWHGEITLTPRGKNGFGYDPHFLIPHLEKTAAEITAAEKAALSHRGQALRWLFAILANFQNTWTAPHGFM